MSSITFSFVLIFAIPGVIAFHTENPKLDAIGEFKINPIIFENSSIRLNISWEGKIIKDAIMDVLIESNMEQCMYTYEEMCYPTNNMVTIPSPSMSDPAELIYPGCDYNITITYESDTYSYFQQIPDCIGDYCACVTEETNFLKLVYVEHVADDIYNVQYNYRNASIGKGKFYIVEISYVESNDSNSFDVAEVKYRKNALEIKMEYLKEGQYYTLYIKYRDADNKNPDCLYVAHLHFEGNPPSDVNYVIFRVASCVSLFITISAMLFCIFRHPKHYLAIMEKIKNCIVPDQYRPPVANLSTTSLKCPHQEINILYTPLEMMGSGKRDAYEIFRENIIIKDVIGEGAFGKVYYAKAFNLSGISGYTMVAVKQLRADAPKEEVADFLAEIKMLKKIGVHKNVVKMLACVTRTEPYMMIMELVSTGDLKEYLLKLRDIWIKSKNKRRFFPDDMEEKLISKSPETDKGNSTDVPELPPRSPRTPDFISKLLLSEGITTFDADTQTPLLADVGGRPDPVLDHKELENFASQIATGMAYLEKIAITHRDLAARNILITKEKLLKISDFGMSRTGPYIKRSLKKVPLRWMAIESIEEFKTDSKSDVWSFGVVLWEIGTLGAFPYENIPNEFLLKELKAGTRLQRPEICTDELYELMQKCWLEGPKSRPNFEELVEQLNFKKRHAYVDFSEINPKYVFPPTDKIYQNIIG